MTDRSGAQLFESRAAFQEAVREAGEWEEYTSMESALRPAVAPDHSTKDDWEEPQAAEVM